MTEALTKNEILMLRKALQASSDREKALYRENQKLRQIIDKLQSSHKTLKQKAKSTRAQVKAQKVKKPSVKTAKVKTIAKIKIEPAKLSKEEIFEMYRQSNLTRFWQRIRSILVPDTPEELQKLNEMEMKVASLSSQRIREIVKITKLHSTYYDSDASWNAAELADWTIDELHKMFM